MISEKAIISAADDAVDCITLSPVYGVEFSGFEFKATIKLQEHDYVDWDLRCDALNAECVKDLYGTHRFDITDELFQFAVRTVVQKLAAGELVAVPAEVVK